MFILSRLAGRRSAAAAGRPGLPVRGRRRLGRRVQRERARRPDRAADGLRRLPRRPWHAADENVHRFAGDHLPAPATGAPPGSPPRRQRAAQRDRSCGEHRRGVQQGFASPAAGLRAAVHRLVHFCEELDGLRPRLANTAHCSDCHDPHYMVKTNAPAAPDTTQPGKSPTRAATGSRTTRSAITCHGAGAAVNIQRLITSSNSSYHPLDPGPKPVRAEPHPALHGAELRQLHELPRQRQQNILGPHGSAFRRS